MIIGNGNVEGKIAHGKRGFGLGLIRKKLANAECLSIELIVLVMNLVMLLELLVVLFATILKESAQSVRNLPLKPQMSALRSSNRVFNKGPFH
jgi:hypothetical protein